MADQQGRWDLLNLWFRPKQFESERIYERLGALILKRYLPTGGDLVMQRLRRRGRELRFIDSRVQSLRRFERWTRIAESVHLLSFVVFTRLAVRRFSTGSLSVAGFATAMGLTVTLGLWPVVLQRYNRLRIYRVIETASGISV